MDELKLKAGTRVKLTSNDADDDTVIFGTIGSVDRTHIALRVGKAGPVTVFRVSDFNVESVPEPVLDGLYMNTRGVIIRLEEGVRARYIRSELVRVEEAFSFKEAYAPQVHEGTLVRFADLDGKLVTR